MPDRFDSFVANLMKPPKTGTGGRFNLGSPTKPKPKRVAPRPGSFTPNTPGAAGKPTPAKGQFPPPGGNLEQMPGVYPDPPGYGGGYGPGPNPPYGGNNLEQFPGIYPDPPGYGGPVTGQPLRPIGGAREQYPGLGGGLGSSGMPRGGNPMEQYPGFGGGYGNQPSEAEQRLMRIIAAVTGRGGGGRR